MHIYLYILLGLYMIIAVGVACFVGYNTYKTSKITEKIIGVITLIMLLLRIFLIK